MRQTVEASPFQAGKGGLQVVPGAPGETGGYVSKVLRLTLMVVLPLAGAILAFTVFRPNSTVARPRFSANSTIDMPPFEMVRTVSTGEVVATYDLRFDGQDSWKDTLLSANTPYPDIGRYQEVRNGEKTVFAYGKKVTYKVDPTSVQLPGTWFADQDLVLSRFPSATVSQQSNDRVVTTSNGPDFEQWTFDIGTGIVTGYRKVVGGSAVEEVHVTSLTSLTGQVIR